MTGKGHPIAGEDAAAHQGPGAAHSARVGPSHPLVGQTLHNHRILDKLGAGGMGEVFLAEHTRLGRKAAVKMIHAPLSANSDAVARLFGEARATASLRHPGIVEVYDCDVHSDGRAYLVMEHLEGETLAERLRRGPLAPDYALVATAGAQIAAALAAAHAGGIVHRDLKPANIFVLREPAWPRGLAMKVLDFGTAKLLDDTLSRVGPLTRDGELVGTPLYMSPEQCRGDKQVGPTADVYSLGCVLYEAICGTTPFAADSLGAMIEAHLAAAVPDPKALSPGLPEPLRLLLLAMLEKRPANRPQSAADVRRRLEAIAGAAATLRPGTTRPAQQRPRRWRPLALVGVSVGAAAGGLIAWAREGAAPAPAPVAVPAGPRAPEPARPRPPVAPAAPAAAAPPAAAPAEPPAAAGKASKPAGPAKRARPPRAQRRYLPIED
jgi:eukaryotic-like serine/threonine-protein kinase